MRKRQASGVLFAAAFLVLWVVGTTLAAPATVDRFRWTDETIVLGMGIEPCLPSDNPNVSLTVNTSGHLTAVETGGTFHISVAHQGTFVLDPEDPALPNYVGKFGESLSVNEARTPDTFSVINSVRLVGIADDGSGDRLVSIARFKLTIARSRVVVELLDGACGGG